MDPWAEASDAAADAQELFLALGRTMIGDDTPQRRLPLIRGNKVYYIFTYYAVAVFVLNWLTRFLVVEPFGRILLQRTRKGPEGKVVHKAATKGSVDKFAQSTLEMLTYGAFTLIGLRLVPAQEFSWPSAEWWKAKNALNEEGLDTYALRADLVCFYILYCSRYVAGGISVLFEHRRKDFIEMQIHHWVTAVLVALSYFYGWVHVGVIVMLLLDPADVPLHVAKMSLYVSKSGLSGSHKQVFFQFWADRIFEVFAVTFIVTRCMMYPYLCYSTLTELGLYTTLHTDGQICVILLLILLVLQFYWLFLIIRVAIKMIVSGGAEDVRSDDDETDDEAARRKKD